MAFADGFGAQCDVAIGNTYSTSGTLTRASLATLTPAQIRALFQPVSTGGNAAHRWTELDAYLKHTIEMKACGIRRSALYDWIMSSNKQGMGALVNIQKTAKGPSLIQPFILGRQQSVLNIDHWYVTANAAGNVYGTGNLPVAAQSGNRVVTVKSQFASTWTTSADRFLPGKFVYLIAPNSGAWALAQFKVIQAGANSTDAVDIELEYLQKTSGEISSLSTSASGILIEGPNNVADVESWCYSNLNFNTTKLVPFFYQTRRQVRSVDSHYKEMFAKLMESNRWYATFQDIPLAERNRQDEEKDRKEFMNAFFFGTAYNSNQTITGWGSLPQITSLSGATVDPGTGGKLIAYRANMVGVLPQLQACGQFSDSAGADIEISSFLETTIYNLWRARSSQGKNSNEIDIYTSQGVADQFMVAFLAYSKEKLGDILRLNIDEGTTSLGFPFRRYKLYKPHGVYVNIITDNYFDDLEAMAGDAATVNSPGLGKFLLPLDLGSGGTIYPAVLGSNRKQYTTGRIEDLAKIDSTFSCAMENPTIDRTLTSTTTTAVVECPLNSQALVNFGSITHSPA
jgi:hypothetical protein